MTLATESDTAPRKYSIFQCGIFSECEKNRDKSKMIEPEVVTSHRKILFHVTSTIIFIFCIAHGDVSYLTTAFC